MKKLLIPALLSLSTLSHANWTPFCAQDQSKTEKVIAYFGADSAFALKDDDLPKLGEQLSKVTLVNYSFARLAKDRQGNSILSLSDLDADNIRGLRQLRSDLPIMIAVGGWGEREGFDEFVMSKTKRAIFIQSVLDLMHQYQLDGIDLDWENELLASEKEINGVARLMRELKEAMGQEGFCLSNAVPGSEAYWKKYPQTRLWADAVDWTTIMAYDNYGTFGSRTEHGASLYDTKRDDDKTYPYPTASGDKAVNYYYQQGLAAEKIVLGLPFYCHSYYIENQTIDKNINSPGLYAPVIDPNINSQVSYEQAWQRYGDSLFSYKQQMDEGLDAVSYYGLIPIENTTVSRFMSCDSPASIKSKVAYVSGRNSISERLRKKTKLAGVSFWSLQQDLPFSESHSLLRAIHEGLKQD